MKILTVLVAACAATVLAGCAKTSSVEGERGAKLTLSKPAAVTVARGGMTKTDIHIAREALAGEVSIRFKNLPKGVDVVESDSKIVGDEGVYTLRAGADADLVENYVADVTASAGAGNISVSQPISITVTAAE